MAAMKESALERMTPEEREANPEADYAEARAVEYEQAEERWLSGRTHGAWCSYDCECNRDHSGDYEVAEGNEDDTQTA